MPVGTLALRGDGDRRRATDCRWFLHYNWATNGDALR
jgi:hypothetical protein